MSDHSAVVHNDTIPCAIGEIRAYRGQFLSLYHLHTTDEHLQVLRDISASVRGFHIISRDNGAVCAAFDPESLTAVLRLVNDTKRAKRGNAQLSHTKVQTIRSEHEQGLSQRKLAERHSVSLGVVNKIIARKGCYSSAV